MSTSREDNSAASLSSETPHRSRWHRFSPSMGWRAFWSEILIVVLGVVIALAANETVEDWSWHNKVRDGEARLHGDTTWAFLWMAEKYATLGCVNAQLDGLSRNVLDSGTALKPAPVLVSNNMHYIVRMPNRPFRFPTWDALVADGSATRFAPQRQAFLGNISDAMAQARVSEAEALRLMGRLLVMRDPIELDPVVRANLLSSINELRILTENQALNALQRMRMIADAGSAPRPEAVDAFLDGSRNTNPSGSDYSGTVQFCKAQGLPLADWRDYQKVSAGSNVPSASVTPK